MVYSNLINSPLIDQILPKKMEQEKKIRREIANSNERRRMQSINAGFNSLRTMLPKHDNEKLSKAAILQHTAEYIDQLEQDKTRFLQEIRTIKKLLNPELLEQYQKNQTELKLIEQQPFKRIKLEVNSLDLSNSESSDEGIICNSSPKQDNQLINQQQNLIINKLDSNENGSTLVNNYQTTQIISNNIITKTTNDIIESSDNIDVLRAELVEVRKVLDKERKLRMKLEEQVRVLEAQLYPTKIKEIAQQVQLQFQTTTSNSLTNQYAQIQFQNSKDSETEAAVTSVIVDQLNQNDIIAETVEIETQDCTDYLVNTNTINLLTSNNQQTNNNVPALNLTIQSDSLTNNSCSNKNLLDTTNLINQNKDKLSNDTPNKILTSTAYLTTTANINSSNKTQQQFKISSKSTSSNQKSDKNHSQNKQKQIKNTSSNLITQNSQLNSSSSSSINQTSELNNNKQQDKLTTSAAACIALPLFSNLPIIYDNKSIEINSDTLNKLDQSSIIEPITPNTVTIQIIDSNLIATSSIDNKVSTTNNITITNNDSSTTANRNNNLHTIVEAIKHLEGDRFYDNQNLIKQDNKQENFLIVTADQLINRNHDLNSGILIETIKSNLNTTNSRGVIVSSANH